MFRARFRRSGKPLRVCQCSKTLSLDISAGRSGVLLQVLPYVCSAGQTNAVRLAHLNAAVRALRQLAASRSLPADESKDEKIESNSDNGEESTLLTNLPEQSSNFARRRGSALFRRRGGSKNESLKLNCEDWTDTSYVQQKNELNKESYRSKKPFKNQLIDLDKDSLDVGCEHSESDIFASFSDNKTCCKNGPLDDVSLSNFASHEQCDAGTEMGSKEKEALEFTDCPFTMQEFFCMLRCCLVCDGHDVRSSGMRLMRHLLVSKSDATAFFGAGIVPLLVRCVDAQGGITSVERTQSLRLLRRLVQVSAGRSPDCEDGQQEQDDTAGQKKTPKTTKDESSFPHGLIYPIIALVRFGLEHKDPFMNPAVAMLTEMLLAHTEDGLSCGAVGALHNNLLEYSGAPRIHEAILVTLLWLANTPLYRHHTTHLLQVIAPYTDYHYRHTAYDLEHFTTSEERELRFNSARLCLLLLLRSWPGLLLVARDDLRALRCLTAQFAYTPHVATTAAIITVLSEFFGVRECPRVGRRSEDAPSGGRTRDKSSSRSAGGECHHWDAAVVAYLNSPVVDSELWTLGNGFVAVEAKCTLPRLFRCRPNLVQVQQALVLYVLIKADLLPALCHVIINSPSAVALRATILLGELVHRSHQDLPVECSQLTHALPELMNQAATNFSFMDSLKCQDGTTGERRVAVTTLTNVHSGNPAINIDLFRQRNGVFSRDKTQAVMGVRSSVLFDDAKSRIDVCSNDVGGLRNVAPDLHPTNPYSIPTNTSIVNAATAKMTQAQRRARASTAVSVLLKLSRGRLNPPALPPQHSLYLAHLLDVHKSPSLPTTPVGGVVHPTRGVEATRGIFWDSAGFPEVSSRKKTAFTPVSEEAKMSRWLGGGGSELEELVQRALKRCHVLTLGHCHHRWHWDLVIALLRWPSEQLQRISSSTHRLFVKRVVHFYKPSAELFSRTPGDHVNARKEAEALVLLMQFLLKVPESDSGRHLEELLLDLQEHLKVVCILEPSVQCLLAPQALNSSCSHYYFLMVGVLSRSPRGHELLLLSGVLEQLLELVTRSGSDSYAKLITSSLDYSLEGLNRTILTTVLQDKRINASCRAYATSLLRLLLYTTSCTETCHFLLHQLLHQLSDPSPQVAVVAMSCLYEVAEVPLVLQMLARSPPVLPSRLGNHVHMFTARLLQVPAAYAAYQACGLVDRILVLWEKSLSLAYVQMQESALLEALTEHRRDETGRYGRRSNQPVPIEDVFVYPHLYGALVQHKMGLERVLGQRALGDMIQRVKKGNVDTPLSVLKLKAAVWGVCHVGSSSAGASYITNCGALSAVAGLARHCNVYSVRGTCCMALCLVATTHLGVLALRECGWESAVRDHFQQWQSNVHPLYDITCHHHHNDAHNNHHHRGPTAPFYTALQDDNYIGHTPKSGFYMSGDSDEEEASSESDDEESLAGVDDARLPAHRKAQTLPNQMRGSGGGMISHQRSLSDCAPVAEEQATTAQDDTSAPNQSEECSDLGLPPLSGGSAKAWVRRGSLRFNKLIFSMKKKKSRKRHGSQSTRSSHDTQGSTPNPLDSSPSPPVSPGCQLDTQVFPYSPNLTSNQAYTQPWVFPPPPCHTSHCLCTFPTHRPTSPNGVCHLSPTQHFHAPVLPSSDTCTSPASDAETSCRVRCFTPVARPVSSSLRNELTSAALSSDYTSRHRNSDTSAADDGERATGILGSPSYAKQESNRGRTTPRLDNRLTSPQDSLSPPTPRLSSCFISPSHHSPHCPCLTSPPVSAGSGLPKTASQSSMVSVPSRVSLQGCQLLLAMSEQRRTASESDHEQQQRRRDCLTTLLADHTASEHQNYFRATGGDTGKLGFSRTASGISRISSSGSLGAHFCDSRNVAVGASPAGFGVAHSDAPSATSASNRPCSCHTHAVSCKNLPHNCTCIFQAPDSQQSTELSVGASSGSEAPALARQNCPSCLARDLKFADAQHTVISDECGRQSSADDSRDGSSIVTVVNRGLDQSKQYAHKGFQTFSHRAVDQKSTVLDCCGGQIYMGLCLPLDLSLLLDTKGHWDVFSSRAGDGGPSQGSGVADKSGARSQELSQEAADADKASSDASKSGGEKDKWREGAAEKRLETVREESFNSADGGSSTSTAVTNNTALTSMTSGESMSASSDSVTDTGLPLHSKTTCLGCFSLCNRQEIAQPIEMISLDQTGAQPPMSGANALLGSLRAWDLESASRPNTPMDKWESVPGMASSAGGCARTDHSRVLVRKEIVRFLTRLACPLTAKSSEAGLLSLKQRWPEAFRDVCTYSEALLLISSAPYSLSARHFVHEIFQDVAFSEVFEEAECLLRRANITPSPHAPPAYQAPDPSPAPFRDLSPGRGPLRGSGLLKEVLHIEEGSKQPKGAVVHTRRKAFGKAKSKSKSKEEEKSEDVAAVGKSDGDSSTQDTDSKTSASNSTSNTLTGESFPYSEYHTNTTATSNSATANEKSVSAPGVDGSRRLTGTNEDVQIPDAAENGLVNDADNDRLMDDAAMADGGIVLLTRQHTLDSSCAGADLSLSDWDGLSTDDESEHQTP